MKTTFNSTSNLFKSSWYLKIFSIFHKRIGALSELGRSPFYKRVIFPTFFWVGFVSLILLFIRFFIPMIFEGAMQMSQASRSVIPFMDTVLVNTKMDEYAVKIQSLEGKIHHLSISPYILINTTKNEFKLYKGGKLIREGICSTGSYVKLEYNREKRWVFRTPKGMFRIKGKTKYPVWKKPDWAFVEEGKPIPSLNHPSRYEYGVLGDYSLSLGDGYLIHGTLYQRMLGMPVTHGCVRLGDDDLEIVYQSLNIGDRVFIF